MPRSGVIPTLCLCPYQQLRTQPDFPPEHKGFSQRCITTIVLLLQGFQLFFLEAIITVQVSRSMRLEYKKKISFCISRNVRMHCLMHMERMTVYSGFLSSYFELHYTSHFVGVKREGFLFFPLRDRKKGLSRKKEGRKSDQKQNQTPCSKRKSRYTVLTSFI